MRVQVPPEVYKDTSRSATIGKISRKHRLARAVVEQPTVGRPTNWPEVQPNEEAVKGFAKAQGEAAACHHSAGDTEFAVALWRESAAAGHPGAIRQLRLFETMKSLGIDETLNEHVKQEAQLETTRCSVCLRTAVEVGKPIRKCQRCKCVYFCGKECQKANWKAHKKVCHIALE